MPHSIAIEIGGRLYTPRGTFGLARDIEAAHGRVFEVAREVITGAVSVEKLADLLHLLAPGATRGEIEGHFDEVGIAGVQTEIAGVLARMVRGFGALSEEAEASGAANPHPCRDQTSIAARRRGPGRPAGARNRRKEASPGATSSAEPPVSASSPAISGAPPLPSSQPSGEPQNPEPQPLPVAATSTTPGAFGLFSDPSPATA